MAAAEARLLFTHANTCVIFDKQRKVQSCSTCPCSSVVACQRQGPLHSLIPDISILFSYPALPPQLRNRRGSIGEVSIVRRKGLSINGHDSGRGSSMLEAASTHGSSNDLIPTLSSALSESSVRVSLPLTARLVHFATSKSCTMSDVKALFFVIRRKAPACSRVFRRR